MQHSASRGHRAPVVNQLSVVPTNGAEAVTTPPKIIGCKYHLRPYEKLFHPSFRCLANQIYLPTRSVLKDVVNTVRNVASSKFVLAMQCLSRVFLANWVKGIQPFLPLSWQDSGTNFPYLHRFYLGGAKKRQFSKVYIFKYIYLFVAR